MIPQPCSQLVTSKTSPDRCVRCEHPSSAHARSEHLAGIKTTHIWGDTLRPELCKSCRAPIHFAQIVRSGKWMPFTGRPVAISKSLDLQLCREKWLVNLAASHFATCSAAAQFRRRQ